MYPITGRERMYALDLARKEAEQAVSLPPYALDWIERAALGQLHICGRARQGGNKEPFLVWAGPMIVLAVQTELTLLRQFPRTEPPGINIHAQLSDGAREFEDLCVDMPELSLEETERLAGLEPEGL